MKLRSARSCPAPDPEERRFVAGLPRSFSLTILTDPLRLPGGQFEFVLMLFGDDVAGKCDEGACCICQPLRAGVGNHIGRSRSRGHVDRRFHNRQWKPRRIRRRITFVLNGDGTISADLISTLAGAFQGFGFDSVEFGLTESNFAPTTPDNPFGWTDLYGVHASGFLCSSCGTSETWTIGTPGEFTSVFQALGGNNASTDFYLLSQTGDEWGANVSSVPEGSTWGMMLLGFAGLGFAGYRRARAGRSAPVVAR
jgi:hypothetical protein